MNDFNSLFTCNTYKLKPKDSSNVLKQFRLKYKMLNDFEMIKKSSENLKYLNQKHFVIQINNIYNVESYIFSVYKDKTGYYLSDHNRFGHFHSFENLLKYQLSKIYLRNYNNESSIEYYCYNYEYNSEVNENEYVNNAYLNGKRIII